MMVTNVSCVVGIVGVNKFVQVHYEFGILRNDSVALAPLCTKSTDMHSWQTTLCSCRDYILRSQPWLCEYYAPAVFSRTNLPGEKQRSSRHCSIVDQWVS